jgi:hypothetical protein
VHGDTFRAANPELCPKVQLSSQCVAFPACQPGQRQHQTLMLTNYGDTPVAYHFQAPAAGGEPAFTVLPARGVAAPHSHVLVALRFCPTAAGDYELAVRVRGCRHSIAETQ